MKDQRHGIIAGGNWLLDHVKTIDAWPPQDALANIVSESWGNGGAPYNVLKDLARLGAPFPLAGIGLLGADENGARILEDCARHGIDTSHLRRTAEAATSYSDVMTDRTTGRRTFFHHRGANALLSPDDFDFSRSRARRFHLGYLLLLDHLDALEQGRPRACGVLERASAAGIATSLDCVSEHSDRFDLVVKPALPYVDVLFVNDFEAEKLTRIPLQGHLTEAGRMTAVENAAAALLEFGVREWVVLHYPEAVLALGKSGAKHWQPSVRVPGDSIRGTAGAGDAFAAGVLFGLHESWPMPNSLRLGVCAAATSLGHVTCSEGVLDWERCLGFGASCGYRLLPE